MLIFFNNNYLYNLRSFFLIKFNIFKYNDIIKISSLFFFLYFKIDQYRQNILLSYIVINLFFDNIYKNLKFCSKNKIDSSDQYLLKFKVLNDSIFLFLFIHFYLPCIENKSHTIRLLGLNQQNSLFFLDFISFPIIPEIDGFYEKFSEVYNILKRYKFKILFKFNKTFIKLIYVEFILKSYKLLCITF